MKVAIIGSRERSFINKTKKEVEDLVDQLQDYDVVVSGGCRGVDTWAVDYAKIRGMETLEFKPIMMCDNPSYPYLVKAYYARNRKIVDNSDIVYAFPSKSGLKGGTRYTVEYAIKCGKKVILK